jgi:hypothetical protein
MNDHIGLLNGLSCQCAVDALMSKRYRESRIVIECHYNAQRADDILRLSTLCGSVRARALKQQTGCVCRSHEYKRYQS